MTTPAPNTPLNAPGTAAPGTITPAPGTISPAPGTTTTPGTTGMNLAPGFTAPGAPAPGINRSGVFGYGYGGGGPLRADNTTRARNVARLAQGVPGVTIAYAMVTGNTALVGVQPSPGSNPSSVERSVANVLRTADPTLTQLIVTSDPRSVNSMRLIEAQNARGQVTNIDAAMRDIIAKLPPTRVQR